MSAKNSSTLLDIQRDFLAHLYDDKKLKIINSLLPYSSHEALARLNIYRNNVFSNFSSVLASVFCVTKKILGDKKFFLFVEQYIKSYHSRSGNLDEYGEFFPEFLNKIVKKHKLNYLSDLATIELAHYKTFFAKITKDEFPLTKFKKTLPEDFSALTFTLHPSCTLFASKFPVYSIWNKEKKSNSKKSEFILVVNSTKPLVEQLSEIEFLFLIEIGEGKKLHQAYQKICKKIKKEFNIGKMLNHFIANRIIVDFRHDCEVSFVVK